jgi:hypothetical protein
MYSSALTTDSQTYPRINCESADYYYEAILVNVITAGFYNLSSYDNISTYASIYKNDFNPFNPSKNLLSNGPLDCTISDSIYLETNTTYILIVATYYPKMTGAFWIFIFGPNEVSLNRTSEYLYGLFSIKHSTQ